jgi:hypothetical protein
LWWCMLVSNFNWQLFEPTADKLGTPSKHNMYECYCPTSHIITKIIIPLGNRICLIC